MGAQDFETISAGRNATEAFHSAVEQARYMNGHGGYSGTIAEKHTYDVVDVPKRISSAKLAAMIAGEQKPTTDACKAIVDRFARTYNDKYAPALCLALAGKELSEAKAAMGLKGTRKRVFRFIGIASS